MNAPGVPSDAASTGASGGAAAAAPAPAASAPAQPRKISRFAAIVADFLERAGWSAGEQFFAVLFTTPAITVAGLPWAAASVTAVAAGIISLLTTFVEYAVPPAKRANYWTDLVLRLGKTFVASLFGSMSAQAAFGFLHIGWTAALNLAAVATLEALGKGLLARNSSGVPNPSTLSTATYDTARRS